MTRESECRVCLPEVIQCVHFDGRAIQLLPPEATDVYRPGFKPGFTTAGPGTLDAAGTLGDIRVTIRRREMYPGWFATETAAEPDFAYREALLLGGA